MSVSLSLSVNGKAVTADVDPRTLLVQFIREGLGRDDAAVPVGERVCAGNIQALQDPLMVLGAAKMGNLIRFIPYPVTTGFTAGIATVIATLQIKDILGRRDKMKEDIEKMVAERGEADVFFQ